MEGVSSIPSTQRRLKFQDGLKVKEHGSERYASMSHIEKQINADRSSNDLKTLRNSYSRSVVTKGMDVKDHHKSITRPPISFGQSNKGGTLQDKASNVRVLNWDHTDNWKHNQVGVVDTGSHNSSSERSNSWSSLASKLYYESYGCPTRQTASITSTVGFVPGEPNRERIVCLLSPQKPVSNVLTKPPRTEIYANGNYSHLRPGRDEAKEISTLNLKDDKFHINSKPAGVYETKKVLDMLHKSHAKNLTKTEMYTEIKRTISTMRSVRIPDMPKASTISDQKMENKVGKPPNSSAKLSYQVCPQKNENVIVHLNRDVYSTPLGDFLLPESKVSTDENLESNWRSAADVLSVSEDCLSNHVSGLPQSFPQPSFLDSSGGTSTNPKTYPNMKDVHTAMVVPKASRSFLKVESSDSLCEQGDLISEHCEFSPVESSLTSDHTYLDQAAQSSRNPSPMRRLSNGFIHMRRSFSSKDKSVIPQSNSKRFPVSVGVSSSPVVPFVDRSEAPRKARSSPLRRLIDPILKPKVALTSPYVDDNTGSACKLLDKASQSQIEKKKKDTVQALLQCSTQNGLFMFKFVTKKKGDALVATMANPSALEKPDLSVNFTMYSVNEIGKNNSRKYQVKTGKSCGYLYNIIGHMKFCIPCSNETIDDLSSRNYFSAVESTLFEVQPSKSDQETMKVKPSGELAALVIKTPNDCLRFIGNTNNRDKFLRDFTECFSEANLSNLTGCVKRLSTTVILPAGVHSMPNKGAPSPLIHRWRSGGSCDCGGWDIGCNLSLLQNEIDKACFKPAEQGNDSPTTDCFHLFSQTVAHGKDPSFRLTPFNKGLYLVDFKPSIMSDIQAFFISITMLSSQVTFELSKETE